MGNFKSLINRLTVQAGDPYAMGFDCAVNGSNTTNCHFGLFSTAEKMRQWERGKEAGERFKKGERATPKASGDL